MPSTETTSTNRHAASNHIARAALFLLGDDPHVSLIPKVSLINNSENLLNAAYALYETRSEDFPLTISDCVNIVLAANASK